MNLQVRQHRSPGRPFGLQGRGSSNFLPTWLGGEWPPSLEGYSLPTLHFLSMGLGEDRLCWDTRTVFGPGFFIHRTHPVSEAARQWLGRGPRLEESGRQPIWDSPYFPTRVEGKICLFNGLADDRWTGRLGAESGDSVYCALAS
jgi:hypothetical protein